MKTRQDFYAILASLVPALLSLGHYALITRIIDAEAFGTWAVFLNGVGLMELLRTGIVQTGLVRIVSGQQCDEQPIIFRQAFFLGSMVSMIGCIGLLISGFLLEHLTLPAYQLLFTWLPWVFLGSYPLLFVSWFYQTQRMFIHMMLLELIWSVGFIVFLCISLYQPVPFYALPIFYGSMKLVVGVLFLFSLRKPYWWGSFRMETVQALWAFGRFNAVTLVARHLFKSTPIFLIPLWQSTAWVGIFQIALKLFEGIEILIRGLLLSAYPLLASLFNQGKRAFFKKALVRYVKRSSTVAILSAAVLWMFAPWFTRLLGGELGGQSDGVLRVMLLSAVFIPFERFSGICLDVFNQPALNLIKHMVMLFLMIGINILIVQCSFDLRWLAATNSIVYLIGGLIGWLFVGYTAKKHFSIFWK